jgi:hypothetical protein
MSEIKLPVEPCKICLRPSSWEVNYIDEQEVEHCVFVCEKDFDLYKDLPNVAFRGI